MKKQLGQYWTPDSVVQQMIALIRNHGSILEPSSGSGSFSSRLNCTAIEIDADVATKDSIIMDFFDYPVSNKFDTIIGNPPYVPYKDIGEGTKEKLTSKRLNKYCNLYLFFIEKCIEQLKPHGELIFIVPKHFTKAAGAQKLNQYIYESGTITDYIDLGESVLFSGARPNCVIFRFEKDNFTRVTNGNQTFSCVQGQLLFTNNTNSGVLFSDLFHIKVGAVSGADDLYISPDGNREFVFPSTMKTGKTVKMIYDLKTPFLEQNKETLINRRVIRFTENNWWLWGRRCYESDSPRIYLCVRTRELTPFFCHPCPWYVGSIFGIFPKFDADYQLCTEIATELNMIDWTRMGFKSGSRYVFSASGLARTILPDTFRKYLEEE